MLFQWFLRIWYIYEFLVRTIRSFAFKKIQRKLSQKIRKSMQLWQIFQRNIIKILFVTCRLGIVVMLLYRHNVYSITINRPSDSHTKTSYHQGNSPLYVRRYLYHFIWFCYYNNIHNLIHKLFLYDYSIYLVSISGSLLWQILSDIYLSVCNV